MAFPLWACALSYLQHHSFGFSERKEKDAQRNINLYCVAATVSLASFALLDTYDGVLRKASSQIMWITSGLRRHCFPVLSLDDSTQRTDFPSNFLTTFRSHSAINQSCCQIRVIKFNSGEKTRLDSRM